MYYRRGHWVRQRGSKDGGAGLLVLLVIGGIATCINKAEETLGCSGSGSKTPMSHSAPPAATVDRAPVAASDRWNDLAELFKGQDTSWLLARGDLALKTKPLTEDALHEAYLAVAAVAPADRKRADVKRLQRLADAKAKGLRRAK